ncbi:MAG TPA: BLUF domain-containing protein [Sulfuricurvum sp.]|nr:BLUF domain-containing protein [Sulfuricurvum sp.]
MKQIIYASTATESVDYDVIKDLLTQCVAKNDEFGISGMLVFDGKQFLQCFEGNEASVMQLKENIFKDIRHHSVNLIGEKEITKRLFSQWCMGYLNNERAIQEVFMDVSGSGKYTFKNLSYEQAKLILLKLSFMI